MMDGLSIETVVTIIFICIIVLVAIEANSNKW